MKHDASPREGWTLFLDFDGVLNNDGFLRHQRNHVPPDEHRLFDPANVRALDYLCEHLPVSKIVVTSTWRLERDIEALRDLLRAAGFARCAIVDGTTPELGTRADEITDYLSSDPSPRWLILDDMNLGDGFGERFFKISVATGLTEAMCEQILHALRGEQ